MSKQQKFKTYLRQCTRCGRMYRTTARRGISCPACYKLNPVMRNWLKTIKNGKVVIIDDARDVVIVKGKEFQGMSSIGMEIKKQIKRRIG